MTTWWLYDGETGWSDFHTKCEALEAAREELKAYQDHAGSDGWGDGVQQLSVWKTKRKSPPEATCSDWIAHFGTKVAETYESFRDERPDLPDGLEGDDLEDWKDDNWPVSWDFDTIVEYGLREVTPPEEPS